MLKRTVNYLAPALFIALATGCAGGDRAKQLEASNQNLGSQLADARAALDGANRNREELQRRLMAALRDAESLRAQMAQMPTPQEAAPGWTPVPGGAMIVIEDDVLFAAGKNSLRDQAKRTLDGIVSTLQGEYAEKDIVIFGHTDNNPIKKSGWDDNWQLSSERALEVGRYLQQHGIAPKRIVAGGCGENRPRVDNNSDAGRQKNRRVEIYAVNLQLEPRKR